MDMLPFVKCTMYVLKQVISTKQKTLIQPKKTLMLIDSSSPSLVAAISKVLALMCLSLVRREIRLGYTNTFILFSGRSVRLMCNVCPTHFTR